MRTQPRPPHVIWFMLLAVVLAPNGLLAGPGADRGLVVFGDSLSDEGNLFFETGESARPPFEPIASEPYAVGGHHFSNGATWIAYLAASLGVPQGAGPALVAPGTFTNYAYGRSRARSDAPAYPDYPLTEQVGLFLGDFGGDAPPEALYVVWTGSNDVRDALSALAVDPTGATSAAILGAALSAIQDNLIALRSAGAERFLVLNVPNIASTPYIRQLGALDPVIPIVAQQLAEQFNAGLAALLAALGPMTGAQFLSLDTFAFLESLVADPASAGLENVTEPCLAFGVVGNAYCAAPLRYLYWDGIHPTTAAHAALARAAIDLVTGD